MKPSTDCIASSFFNDSLSANFQPRPMWPVDDYELFLVSIIAIISTTGFRIGYKRVNRIQKKPNQKDQDMIEQAHKVQSRPNAHFYILHVRCKADLFFIHYVATTWAQLQLIIILLLLLNYIVIEKFDEVILFSKQIEIAQSICFSMYLCFLDGGVGKYINKDLSQLVFIVIIIWI